MSEWDAMVPQYMELMEQLEPAFAVATEAMLDAIEAAPGVRVLDLACGLGTSAADAHQRGAAAVGLDLSPKMLEMARQRFPDVRFEHGDMLAPPAGPWDGITCRFGGHHVDVAWIRAAYDAWAPGGRLAFVEWGPHDGGTGDERHEHDWQDMVKQAGFVDVVSQPLRLVFPQVEGVPNEGDVFLISARRPTNSEGP